MIIYKTTNLINGKFYIGQDTHNNPSYLGSGTILKQAIKKYGREHFIKEILEQCDTQAELNEREKYWIQETHALELGYNLAEGGFGVSNMSDDIKQKISKSKIGKKMSDATRQKMSIIFRGRKVSEETKRKLREINTGKKLSAEHKQKLREKRLGTKLTEEQKRKIGEKSKLYRHSEESKQKIRLANTGRKHSEITKQKIGEKSKNKKISEQHKQLLRSFALGNQWNKGRKHTEEVKQKIANASRGRTHSEETKKLLSDLQTTRKKVCQIDPTTKEIVKIYDSIYSAVNETKINRANVSTCLNHPTVRPNAGGYEWKFYTGE